LAAFHCAINWWIGIALPHIAAGDNLNIPVVGNVLQHGGAFFIRRTFGDDPLYQEIVKEYVEVLLTRGHNIEVFIEGTRSRMGKLLQPKFGILKIVLESLLNGGVEDCTIVPMSIDYDKVLYLHYLISSI
jgi:glycerol-3-phosphate O-acyltransferase